MSRGYYVYILSSRSRNLYTGVTNNLFRRVIEHKKGLVPGFTLRYRIHRLVHFESFTEVHEAIAREKQIKAWDRKKRIALIERANPSWGDLAEGWLAKQKANADPSPHGGVQDGANSVAVQLLMSCHSEEPRDEESASGFASTHDKRIRKITNA